MVSSPVRAASEHREAAREPVASARLPIPRARQRFLMPAMSASRSGPRWAREVPLEVLHRQFFEHAVGTSVVRCRPPPRAGVDHAQLRVERLHVRRAIGTRRSRATGGHGSWKKLNRTAPSRQPRAGLAIAKLANALLVSKTGSDAEQVEVRQARREPIREVEVGVVEGRRI